MARNIIKLLQKSDQVKRRSLIKTLGDTRNNTPAVMGLTHVVEGIMGYKGRFFNLFSQKPEYYSLDEQLLAVLALGETKSMHAYEYLKQLRRFNIVNIPDGVDYDSYGNPKHSFPRFRIEFPFANGPLRKALDFNYSFSYRSFNPDYPGSRFNFMDDIDEVMHSLSYARNTRHAYRIIKKSYMKLKEDLIIVP